MYFCSRVRIAKWIRIWIKSGHNAADSNKILQWKDYFFGIMTHFSSKKNHMRLQFEASQTVTITYFNGMTWTKFENVDPLFSEIWPVRIPKIVQLQSFPTKEKNDNNNSQTLRKCAYKSVYWSLKMWWLELNLIHRLLTVCKLSSWHQSIVWKVWFGSFVYLIRLYCNRREEKPRSVRFNQIKENFD